MRGTTVHLTFLSWFSVLIVFSILPCIQWRGRSEFENSLWQKWYLLGSHRRPICGATLHRGLLKIPHRESRRHYRPGDSIVRGHQWWSAHEGRWLGILSLRDLSRLPWRWPIGISLRAKNARSRINHDKTNSCKQWMQWVKSSKTCPPYSYAGHSRTFSLQQFHMAFLQQRRDSPHWRGRHNKTLLLLRWQYTRYFIFTFSSF